jgi:Sulfotransferase family
MFFIVGSARSGTTLLRLMLNAHSEIAVPPESRFITELWTNEDEVNVEAFLQRLDSHRLFRVWELPIDKVRAEIEGVERARYGDVIVGVYRAFAHAAGKTRFGDKTPRYVEHLSFLAQLFPHARFVHLVRDGRNVALSYADVPFGPKTVARAASLWDRRVRKGIEIGRKLEHGRYFELRYEDLVEEPEGELKSLCEFLDVAYEPAMLDYARRARDSVLSRASVYNPHLSEKPNPEVRTWQDAMPEAQVKIFEAIAGDRLTELGYERCYPQISPTVRLSAALGRTGAPLHRLKRSRA